MALLLLEHIYPSEQIHWPKGEPILFVWVGVASSLFSTLVSLLMFSRVATWRAYCVPRSRSTGGGHRASGRSRRATAYSACRTSVSGEYISPSASSELRRASTYSGGGTNSSGGAHISSASGELRPCPTLYAAPAPVTMHRNGIPDVLQQPQSNLAPQNYHAPVHTRGWLVHLALSPSPATTDSGKGW